MQFERSIRSDGYARVLGLLRDRMGFTVENAKVVNLRVGYPRNRSGLQQRADQTRRLVEAILAHRADAPNLIDGAVLSAQVAGNASFFEADAIAARFDGPIHAGEVAKSFPIVDGRPEPGKLGAALDQVAIYLLLTQRLVSELGGNPESAVSTTAMLIAPLNVGLQPTLATQQVRARLRRVRQLLERPLPVAELSSRLQPGVFERVAEQSSDDKARLRELDHVVDIVGSRLTPECLSSRAGLPGTAAQPPATAVSGARPPSSGAEQSGLTASRCAIAGPGGQSLADGARPTPIETPIAKQLVRAQRLYQAKGALPMPPGRRPLEPARRTPRRQSPRARTGDPTSLHAPPPAP